MVEEVVGDKGGMMLLYMVEKSGSFSSDEDVRCGSKEEYSGLEGGCKVGLFGRKEARGSRFADWSNLL